MLKAPQTTVAAEAVLACRDFLHALKLVHCCECKLGAHLEAVIDVRRLAGYPHRGTYWFARILSVTSA